MRKYILVFLFVVMWVSVGCGQSDIDVTIKFIAVGDNGLSGSASVYDLRYSADSLDWDNAIQINNEPIPRISGTMEEITTTLNLLGETEYYFALKAGDEIPNWSPMSNVVSFLTPDNIAPGTVIILEINWK